MAYAIPRKIGQVAGYHVFGVIVVYPFKIAELAFHRFGGSEKIADLNIDAFFALIGDEVDLIVIGFADFYVISAGEKFEIDDAFMADLLALAGKEKVEFDEAEYNRSLPLIKTQLKALIARDLWDMSEYFQVMNTTDRTVQQALKVLNEGEYERVMASPMLKASPGE